MKATEDVRSNPTVHGQSVRAQPRTMRSIFRGHLGSILTGAVVLTLTNVLMLSLPRLINDTIEFVEKGNQQKDLLFELGFPTKTVISIVSAIALIAALAAVFRILSRVILFNVGRDVEREVRAELFSHLSSLSPTYYAGQPIGDLMSRLTNDLNNIRLMSGFALLNIINAIQVFVVTLPLLFKLDWQVTLAALIPFPLVIVAAQGLAKVMYARTMQSQKALGELSTHVQENLAGQHVIRAFSQEENEIQRFESTNHNAYEASMKLAMIRIVFFPLMGLMSSLGIAISLYAGGRAVIDGRMTIGDVVEFNTRLVQLTWPAIAMGFIVSVYQRGKAGLARINEILGARPDIVDGPHAGEIAGEIQANDLSFTYAEQTTPALAPLSFHVHPGEILGVVGTSGSGKTTLVRALSRLLPLKPNVLSFDRRSIETWQLSSLSAQVAVVTDDGFLFSATLKENIAFGRPNASDDEIDRVVELADLSRDIQAFQHGLDTLVGERGVTLSGGQKQRVALARALLTKPRILILDDSLSAVDAETEARIIEGLRGNGISSPPTLIVISHRLSVVRNANEILVLHEGRCVERGKHEPLLERHGLYAELWGREQLLTAIEKNGTNEQGSANKSRVTS